MCDIIYERVLRDASNSPTFDRPGTSVECHACVLMMEYYHEHLKSGAF